MNRKQRFQSPQFEFYITFNTIAWSWSPIRTQLYFFTRNTHLFRLICTLNRVPDMNQLSRLALNVYCTYQDATDRDFAVFYFCGTGWNWSGCCSFVLLWHKRFLWCFPIGNNKVGSHQEIMETRKLTPTAGPSVWKFFFSTNYTLRMKCGEGCHHAENMKYILQ
jgi:hypothetical protein